MCMEHCTIAAVRYLNTVPLIEGLDDLRGVEVVLAAPSRIGAMIRAGDADLGLASVIEASDHASELVMIPSGMIGCDGATMTVRLFSSVPLEEITEVYADTDSRTSVMLCRVLLNRLFGITPRIVEFDARERVVVGRGAGSGAEPGLGDEWPRALLLIGDKVVTDSPPAVRYPYQLDLGKAWKELTGLPFVYAMWMCRRDCAEFEKIGTAAMVLDRQRRHNMTRMEWIIREHASRHRWPIDLAREYLSGLLRFGVGDAEKAAVKRFFAEVAALEGKPAVVPEYWERRAALGVG